MPHVVKKAAGEARRADSLIATQLGVAIGRREDDWIGGYAVFNHDQVIICGARIQVN